MNSRIRDVRPEDLEAVLALNQDARPAVSDTTLEELTWFREVAVTFRVAEDEGRIVGFLIALTPEVDYGSGNFLWFRSRYDSFVYVDRIVIGKEARGCGLGKRFYQELSQSARSHAPAITLEVNTRPRNDASLAFHDALGFEVVGSRDSEGGAKTVAMMRKSLE